jgi:hypothetical protein
MASPESGAIGLKTVWRDYLDCEVVRPAGFDLPGAKVM